MELANEYTTKYYSLVDELGIKTSPKLDNWFLGLVKNAIALSIESTEVINTKFEHSFNTIKCGREISSRTSEIKWDPDLVDMVCFLHDIARFPESIGNSKLESKVNFDHGDKGAEMFLSQDLSDCTVCVNYRQTIADCIRYHNKKIYVGDDPYVKLTRDSDKLDDFLLIDWQLSFGKKLFKSDLLSKKVIDSFCSYNCVDFRDCSSILDWVVFFLGWYFDINYSATFYLSEEHNVINKYLEFLKKNNCPSEDLEKIQKIVDYIRSQFH